MLLNVFILSTLWREMPLPFEEEDESTIGRNEEDDEFEIENEEENEDEDENDNKNINNKKEKNDADKDMKNFNSMKKSEKSLEILNKSKMEDLKFLDIISDMVLTGHTDGHQPENLLMEIKGYKFAQNKV